MITIELDKFMSYWHYKATFSEGSVLLHAPNGSGKSALLEALPYAHYGKSRVSGDKETANSSLSFDGEGGDGSHCVVVTYDSLFGSEVSLKRGVTKAGKGFFELHRDGVFESKGKEAQATIESLLGLSFEEFLLVSFYGLRGEHSDPVLNLTPTQRLEQLQKFGQADVYPKMLEKASKERKSCETKIHTVDTRIESMEEEQDDVSALFSQQQEAKKEHDRVQEKIDNLRSERSDLNDLEKQYRAKTEEIQSLRSEVRTRESTLLAIDDDISDLESEIEDVKVRQSELIQRRDSEFSNQSVESKTTELNEIKESISALQEEKTRIEFHIELLNTGIASGEHSGVHSCPLCSSDLEPGVIDRWRSDLTESESNRKETEAKLKEQVARKKELETWFSEKDRVFTDVSSTVEDIRAHEKELEKKRSERKALEPKIDWANNRVKDLHEEVENSDQFKGLSESIDRIARDINKASYDLGSMESEIKALQSRIDAAKEAEKNLEKLKKESKALREKHAAYKLLEDAFGRYGVPMRIARRVLRLIEAVATDIYKRYESARVVVEETTDKANPGVRYVLSSRAGKRSFTLLSEGQRAIFYLSLRIAFTHLISKFKNVNIDYLVLDEITAKLDEANRDRLVVMVEQVLRERFPLIFMVSHAPVPNVFDRELHLQLDDYGRTQVTENGNDVGMGE